LFLLLTSKNHKYNKWSHNNKLINAIIQKFINDILKLRQNCTFGPPVLLQFRIWFPDNLIHKFGPHFYKFLQFWSWTTQSNIDR